MIRLLFAPILMLAWLTIDLRADVIGKCTGTTASPKCTTCEYCSYCGKRGKNGKRPENSATCPACEGRAKK